MGGYTVRLNRAFVDGILYVVRTGCAWRHRPVDFPPWQTVTPTSSGSTRAAGRANPHRTAVDPPLPPLCQSWWAEPKRGCRRSPIALSTRVVGEAACRGTRSRPRRFRRRTVEVARDEVRDAPRVGHQPQPTVLPPRPQDEPAVRVGRHGDLPEVRLADARGQVGEVDVPVVELVVLVVHPAEPLVHLREGPRVICPLSCRLELYCNI